MPDNGLRVMSYNIWDGGNDRLENIISVVNEIRPDILVLNEANGFTDKNNEKLTYLSKKTDLRHYYIEVCGDGWGYHVAVLSKKPIVSVRAIKPVLRAIILTKIPVKKDQNICLVGLHLSPFTEPDRVEEVRKLLPEIAGEKSVIVAGDFNSLSPQDDYDDELVSTLPKEAVNKFTVNGKFRYDVLRLLSEHGLLEPVHNGANAQTVPTKVGKTDHFACRLDHILISKDLAAKVQNYNTVINSLTDGASDHYPVYMDIKL
jgi:exodeoxyribonuclease-3